MGRKKVTPPEDSAAGGAATLSPEAAGFIGVLQESNTARNELKGVIQEILCHSDTVGIVKDIVDKTDRDAFRVFVKKFGFAIMNGFSFAAGVIVTILIGKYMK